jgi:hypothetical protein
VSSPVSRPTFDKIMLAQNLGFNKWKKDTCSLCMAKKAKGEKVDSGLHFEEKVKANQQMKWMKQEAKLDDTTLIFSMDVEQALPVPKLRVDAAFFRLKLLLHNFTIADMKNSDVYCYVFTERDANCKAEVYASCVHDYIVKRVEENSELKKIVIYSDNCTAQNKNQVLANMLLAVAIQMSVVIEHHYLVVGHTHLSCDTFHSAVEAKTRNVDQHTVSDYIEAIQTALVGVPTAKVEVNHVDWSFFKSYQLEMLSSIRPGRGVGAPTVQSVRAFRYNPEGKIEYKLLVDDEFEELPQRITVPQVFPEPTPLFTGKLPITENKRKHMLELMEYVPLEKRARYMSDFVDGE